MDTTSAPQMIEHLYKSLNFTPFDVKWIPGTAKFCLMGQTPKAEGILQIFQLNKKELETSDQITKTKGIKASSFGASPANKGHIALGDFDGNLEIYDLETKKAFYSVKAHDQMINCIDAIGGLGGGFGAPEIVTGGRDGCVRVWDQRQKSPVLSLEPVEKEPAIPDCWTVCFGNSYNNDERVIAAGYDNGDLKLFDMRQNSLIWDTNLKNGICGVEFDRKDIMMNKIVATTLEGKFHVFDVRTFNAETGYASLCEPNLKSTVWGVKHLPQNRELFLMQGGNGTGYLYKYNYPPQRVIKDSMGKDRGVIGNVELLNSKELAQQPISGFDWNREKEGLAVLCGLDQSCRDEPILLKSFFSTMKEDEIQFQLAALSALDMIELLINKKNIPNIPSSAVSSYLGLLSNLFLSDNEYELYGYYTATKLKFILILTQKINLSNYEEKLIKQFFKTMHEVYLKEIFNPFNQGDSSKLSNSFQKNVEKIVLDYQTQL